MRALHSLLCCLLLVVGVLVPGDALAARTLAVLPLTPAAGSSAYTGLGDALAGMLISDLSRTPELTLVERARLDALLTEIDLGRTGFIDEKTAAKLGRGLGAELVLLGTWSVVDQTFLLDARVVEVGSGRIRVASAASGSVADFITVEKDLVEALIADLEVDLSSGDRRRMLSDAPTETFEAFAAYGEGLAQERAGRLEQAREAYAKAAASDPSFAQARASIDRLAAAVARQDLALSDERARAAAAIVASTSPPSMEGPRDPEGLAALWLRWIALSDQGEDCQVAAEKLDWLGRTDWSWPVPRTGAEGMALYQALERRADQAAFERVPPAVQAPRRLKSRPIDRARARSLWAFVGGDVALHALGTQDRLVDALLRCHAGSAAVGALGDLRGRVDRAGVEDQAARGRLPLGDHLTLAWAQTHARELGSSPELERTLTVLLERPDAPPAIRSGIDQVRRTLEATRRRTVSRGGAPETTLLAFGDAVLAGDASVIDIERSTCTTLATNEKPRIATFLATARQPGVSDSVRDSTLNNLGPAWRAFHRTGCLTGIPGVWPTFEDVLAGIREALGRIPTDEARASCVRLKAQLQQQSSDAHLGQMRQWGPTAGDQWIWAVLTMLHSLEDEGCIDPLPLSRSPR